MKKSILVNIIKASILITKYLVIMYDLFILYSIMNINVCLFYDKIMFPQIYITFDETVQMWFDDKNSHQVLHDLKIKCDT